MLRLRALGWNPGIPLRRGIESVYEDQRQRLRSFHAGTPAGTGVATE